MLYIIIDVVKSRTHAYTFMSSEAVDVLTMIDNARSSSPASRRKDAPVPTEGAPHAVSPWPIAHSCYSIQNAADAVRLFGVVVSAENYVPCHG